MSETFPLSVQKPEKETQISREAFELFEKEIGSKLYTASNSVYLCNQVDRIIKENYSQESLKQLLDFCEENPETHGEFTEQIKNCLDFLNSNQNVPEDKKEEARSVLKKSFDAFSSATKKLSKFIFLRALPMYAAYFGLANMTQNPDGKYEDRQRAKIELETKGITAEQASTYKLGMSEMMQRGFIPFRYSEDDPKVFQKMFSNIIFGRDNRVPVEEGGQYERNAAMLIPASEDAWNLYLGIPQTNNTFGISDFTPENSKENMYYYKANTFKASFEDFLSQSAQFEKISVKEKMLSYVDNLQKNGNTKVVNSEMLNMERLNASLESSATEIPHVLGDDLSLMFNSYTMSWGQDENGSYISYYDKWDLAEGVENTKMAIGRPFEIYDRIYYSPVTGEILE